MVSRPFLLVAAWGVVLQLLGLAGDAWLHARDPMLAQREGVLTLTNPAHLLFVLGLASVVLGVAFALLDRPPAWARRWGASAQRPGLFLIGPIVLAALAALVFLSASAAGRHPSPAVASVHGTNGAVLPAMAEPGGSAAAQTTAHESAATPSAEELLRAARLVEAVQREAVRFQDVAQARAEGYVQVTPGVQEAAHFRHPGYSADGQLLDPAHPEMLLYVQTAPEAWRLVGVVFTTEGPEQAPPAVGGPLTAWHVHEGLCYAADGRLLATGVGREACGGRYEARSPWMLHVWLVDNPLGVFARTNPLLAGLGQAVAEVEWMVNYDH